MGNEVNSDNVIILREEPEQKVKEITFEKFQVWTVDVVMSTGEGKPIEKHAATTIFRRDLSSSYRLKMTASRYLFNEIAGRFSHFPFSINSIEDVKKARLGTGEMKKHGMLHAFPVLYEKEGALVCHVQFTVLLKTSGSDKITGDCRPLAERCGGVDTDAVVSEDTKAILKLSVKSKVELKERERESKRQKCG